MVQKNSLMQQVKERIIVVAGPTGIGKSAYGIDIAKKYNGEVVGADSVQVYRGLDIGSGKVTESEMQGVPHHLIDVVEPYDSFTVVDFIQKARTIITDIISRNRLPVVVGGTGFYINALLHGYNCGSAGPDENLRARLKKLEEINGEGYLYEMLSAIEPATTIAKNDQFRVIRNLELYLKPKFDEDIAPDYDDMYDALLIVLDADRSKLDELAEKRIRGMLDSGLEDEVAGLKRFFETRALNSVGYREMKHYVKNKDCVTLEETVGDMKQSYHTLIKKQQTFFRWLKWDNKIVSYNGDRIQADIAIKEFLEKK